MFELLLAALEEITVARNGGDWGFGALAELLGSSELAQRIVNAVARLGA